MCFTIIGCLMADNGAPAPSGPAGTTFFAWTNEHRTIRAMVLRCQPLAELQVLPQVNLPCRFVSRLRDSYQARFKGLLQRRPACGCIHGALAANPRFTFHWPRR